MRRDIQVFSRGVLDQLSNFIHKFVPEPFFQAPHVPQSRDTHASIQPLTHAILLLLFPSTPGFCYTHESPKPRLSEWVTCRRRRDDPVSAKIQVFMSPHSRVGIRNGLLIIRTAHSVCSLIVQGTSTRQGLWLRTGQVSAQSGSPAMRIRHQTLIRRCVISQCR